MLKIPFLDRINWWYLFFISESQFQIDAGRMALLWSGRHFWTAIEYPFKQKIRDYVTLDGSNPNLKKKSEKLYHNLFQILMWSIQSDVIVIFRFERFYSVKFTLGLWFSQNKILSFVDWPYKNKNRKYKKWKKH